MISHGRLWDGSPGGREMCRRHRSHTQLSQSWLHGEKQCSEMVFRIAMSVPRSSSALPDLFWALFYPPTAILTCLAWKSHFLDEVFHEKSNFNPILSCSWKFVYILPLRSYQAILALGRWRKKDAEFKTSLDCIGNILSSKARQPTN